MSWRFYVYEILEDDCCVYIGKGCGDRLKNQKRKFRLDGREIARFKREKDAYQFERELIAERKPKLNKAPGGNGSRATPQRIPGKPKWVRDIEAMGTRCYAARVLMRYKPFLPRYGITPENIKRIEGIANTPGI